MNKEEFSFVKLNNLIDEVQKYLKATGRLSTRVEIDYYSACIYDEGILNTSEK